MSIHSLKKNWNFLTNSEVIKSGIPIMRLLVAVSSLATAHLFGYIDRLGIGVGAFIGVEIAGDLFASFASSFLFSVIYVNIIVIVISLISEIFYTKENQCIDDEAKTYAWPDLRPSWRFILIFMFVFPYNYLGNTDFTTALNYGVSVGLVLLSLLITLASFLLWKFSGTQPRYLTSSLIVFLLTFSYYTGELKAASVPEYRLMQIVFADDTRLDGYPLHRVTDGFIFRKRKYFAFDVGTVFIPYSSVKMVTEPSVDSSGGYIFSEDYKGTPEKQAIQPAQVPAEIKRGKLGDGEN